MRDLAGTGQQALNIDLDAESGSLSSSVSREDLQKAASLGGGAPQEQAQTPLEVAVSLGEVALFVSGRPRETWWPLEVTFLPIPLPLISLHVGQGVAMFVARSLNLSSSLCSLLSTS